MISAVIDGFGISHDQPLAFLADNRPAFTVILNEKEKLANPAQAFTQVVYRNVRDDDVFNQPGFDARAFTYDLAFGLAPGVGLYLGNEPGYSDTLIEKTCDAMEVCIEQNRPGYLFNFAVFNPPDSFYGDIRNHERFNRLYARGVFRLCFHDYFSESISAAIQRGAILRPFWKDLHHIYGCAVTEWGYAKNYDPHAGWLTRISEPYYVSQLDAYMMHPANPGYPINLFMWNQWHDFEIKDALLLKRRIRQLNNGLGEMYQLVHDSPNWNVRSGAGIQFERLATIDIRQTPVQLLSMSGGWYRVFIPALNIGGWMYQSGISGLGEVGFRRVG